MNEKSPPAQLELDLPPGRPRPAVRGRQEPVRLAEIRRARGRSRLLDALDQAGLMDGGTENDS